ncbi:MAG: hypothetical protein KC912_26255 [Proteobacteria bacterium]|nr:hypothetical protein [Pseudomonadota bacterium]
MARRRKITGKPLLVASAAAVLAVGCGTGKGGIVTGNLMPPPTVELCVSVTPESATITLNGEPFTAGCVESYEGSPATLVVSAPGYVSQTLEHRHGDIAQVTVVLEAEPVLPEPDIDLPPPPPPPPPVGNLMPPPDLEIPPVDLPDPPE